MATAHLQGKRTGRPRGSKSRPRAILGLLWASRHLGKDVEPPTEEARYWLIVGREQPEKLIKALAALHASDRQRPAQQGTADAGADRAALPTAPELANTRWSGTVGNGNGLKLSIHFQADGKALLTFDDRNTFPGTWTLQGNQLIIEHMGGFTYRSTIQVNIISGTLRESGKTLPFSVAREASPYAP